MLICLYLPSLWKERRNLSHIIIILCTGTSVFSQCSFSQRWLCLTSAAEKKKKKNSAEEISGGALWVSVSLSLQRQGQLCHCQILLRAADCKQQMVELVPERHVNSNHSVFSSACRYYLSRREPLWNQPCFPAGSGVFHGRGFNRLVYGLLFVSRVVPWNPPLPSSSNRHFDIQ